MHALHETVTGHKQIVLLASMSRVLDAMRLAYSGIYYITLPPGKVGRLQRKLADVTSTVRGLKGKKRGNSC